LQQFLAQYCHEIDKNKMSIIKYLYKWVHICNTVFGGHVLNVIVNLKQSIYNGNLWMLTSW
jgi:hypothetical protein